jgi:hypothetical protein
MRTLLQWRNAKTQLVFPVMKSIAKALGVGESTARTYVNKALECGALELVGERKGGRQSPTYRMNLPKPCDNPRDSDGLSPPVSGPHPTGFRPRTIKEPSNEPTTTTRRGG